MRVLILEHSGIDIMALTSYRTLWDRAAPAAGITLHKQRAGAVGEKLFEATAEETLSHPPSCWITPSVFRRCQEGTAQLGVMSSGSSSLSAGWSAASLL
jgi:hypothetical protein